MLNQIRAWHSRAFQLKNGVQIYGRTVNIQLGPCFVLKILYPSLHKKLYSIADMDVVKEVKDSVMWPPMIDGHTMKSVSVTKGTGANGLSIFNITIDPYNCANNFNLFRETFTQVIYLCVINVHSKEQRQFQTCAT